jgi:hypothetical protein
MIDCPQGQHDTIAGRSPSEPRPALEFMQRTIAAVLA